MRIPLLPAGAVEEREVFFYGHRKRTPIPKGKGVRLYMLTCGLGDLDLHGHVPRAPDGGTQVADGDAVAHAVDVRALAAHGSGNKADAVDDIVIYHMYFSYDYPLFHDL